MKVKVDVGHIPHHQGEMHDELLNWAMWAKPGTSASICPMFRAMGYMSNSRQWHQPDFRPTCDILAAQAMEKLICKLPKVNRDALVWFYIHRFGALKARKLFAVTEEGLNSLVVNARQMLMNRS